MGEPTSEKWRKLCSILKQWFHEPDLQALRVLLAMYASHTCIQDDPVWALLIAPPSTGKTSIGIRALSFLPGTYTIGDLGTASLLSGYKEAGGLLSQLPNGNGVLLFPEFSTITHKRPEIRSEIQSQLRAVYDGEFSKQVGSKAKTLRWKGKITVVAACAPQVERQWAVYQDLGERFIYIRWRHNEDAPQIADSVLRQIWMGRGTLAQLRENVLAFVDPESLKPATICTKAPDNAVALCEMICRLRTPIRRGIINGKTQVTYVEATESIARLFRSLCQVAKGNAMLERRAEVSEADFRLVRRIAIDNLPSGRGTLLNLLLHSQDHEISLSEAEQLTNIPHATLFRVREDLIILGAAEEHRRAEKIIRLSSRFLNLALRAGLI
jgi:hypothetical protein